MANGNYKLNSISVSLTQLALEMKEAADAAAEEAADAVVEELKNLLTRLNHRSSKRGVGRFAERYNKPLANATVVKQKSRTSAKVRRWNIYIDHENQRGYNIFDLLDQGSPGIQAGSRKVFPMTTGQLTQTGSFALKRARVIRSDPTQWVNTRKAIQGFTGRHYYQQVADKVYKALGGRSPSKARGRFVYRVSRDEVTTKVIKRKG